MTDATHPARPLRAFGTLRMASKVAAMVLMSVVLMPIQAVVIRCTRGPLSYRIPRLWHRCLCAAMGLRVDVVGTLHTASPTLYVGNHVSHFDILALGTTLPASFIAKDDMERWPGVPFIAGLQQTVFVSRNPRDAAKVTAAVSAQMDRGNHMVLFAEGTTSRGDSVAAFKSSLLALVASRGGDSQQEWTIQPFTIDLREVDGRQLQCDADRDGYAFHGDMDAGAHVKEFLQRRGARLRLLLHPPIRATPALSRKALAALTHDIVASGITACNASGRSGSHESTVSAVRPRPLRA